MRHERRRCAIDWLSAHIRFGNMGAQRYNHFWGYGMNASHEAWKARAAADASPRNLSLGHVVNLLGARACASARRLALRRGYLYAAKRLRAAGVGCGVARVLLLGRA